MFGTVAQNCGLVHNALMTFVNGWFSSLAFVINMLAVGIVFKVYTRWKERQGITPDSPTEYAGHLKQYK